jgi:tRNA nucleotidyltransferase (CCA-adding enzyme)
MEIYLVGGAVRDKRLGIPVRERDWVVVGATPEDMLRQGFKPVGKDFPVYLHPRTREEYALARTECKTAPGYTGFSTCADPDIPLEQDLQRRDLTINAMAETAAGELIDPYGGANDLDNGILRHVSRAFAEDPVRILRVARFAARFTHRGFHVAHETNTLMRQMVTAGEVDHLVPERVWAELVKALEEKTPVRFFDVLYGCGALAKLFPEIVPLFGDDTRARHGHATATFPALQAAVKLDATPPVRFAAVMCDIDQHHAPDHGTTWLLNLCERLRSPNAWRELAAMALNQRAHIHQATAMPAAELLETLNALDAFRRRKRFEDVLRVCQADALAHQLTTDAEYPQGTLLQQAHQAALGVKIDASSMAGKSGQAIGDEIRRRRIAAIQDLIQK